MLFAATQQSSYVQNMNELPKIGERIREERRARGLTQSELAERAGISQQALQKIEGRPQRSSKLTPHIANALGVGVGDLIRGSDIDVDAVRDAQGKYATPSPTDEHTSDSMPMTKITAEFVRDVMPKVPETVQAQILQAARKIAAAYYREELRALEGIVNSARATSTAEDPDC